MDGGFTKYFYIGLMFIVAFIAMYNYITSAIGFGLVFAVQALYTLVFLFDVLKDYARGFKALTLTFPKNPLVENNSVSIPLYWVLCPGVILQFAASLFTVLSTDFLQKKYNSIRLSRNATWNLDLYKWMFILATIALMVLTYSYMCDFTDTISSVKFSGSYKSLLIIAFFISMILPVINVINAHSLSKILVTTTDG